MFPRPSSVTVLGDHRLSVMFEDGVRAELDFSPLLQIGGLAATLRDPAAFAQVRVDPEAQTLVWPNGMDVCPDVLYHLATGAPLPGELTSPPATLLSSSRPAGVAS